MNSTQMLNNFQDQLTKDAGRTAKPRREGITMVLVFDVVNRGPAYIRPFSKLIDRVKLLDTMWHDDLSTVAKYVQEFRELNIDVAFGGTQFEVAKAQGKMSEYLTLLTQ